MLLHLSNLFENQFQGSNSALKTGYQPAAGKMGKLTTLRNQRDPLQPDNYRAEMTALPSEKPSLPIETHTIPSESGLS